MQNAAQPNVVLSGRTVASLEREIKFIVPAARSISLRAWLASVCRPDRDYPPVLLMTSTRDDRVHPGHARKTAARLRELGHPVLFHENTGGGHAGAGDNEQAAHNSALVHTFLWQRLAGPSR